MVKVAFARTEPEAEMLQGLLGEAGIPSMLKRSGGFDNPEFLPNGPRDVFVSQAHAQRAREVLADVMIEDEKRRGDRAGRGTAPRPRRNRRHLAGPAGLLADRRGGRRLPLDLAAVPAELGAEMADLVEVAFVGDEIQAAMIQALLEQHEIPSLQEQVGPSGRQLGEALVNPGGSRRVMVHEHRAEEARAILAEAEVEGEQEAPEPVNARYLEEAEGGRGPRSYGLIGAYVRIFAVWAAAIALMVLAFGLFAAPARRRARLDRDRAADHLAQVVAPGVLDVAEAGVEGVFELDLGALGEELGDEALAGLGAALVLEQVEDRAAEDDGVAARGREGGAGALAQAADRRRPVEADLAGEVLGAAFDQPGPAQVAGEAARRPGGGRAVLLAATTICA